MGIHDGKTYLVTGSSRGIGAGIARHLASEGARVIITYSSRSDAAEKVLSDLPGDGHFCIQLNIGDEGSVQAAFKEVFEKVEKLDGLVNNAGITRDQLLLRMKSEDFNDVIDTNLKGAFYCTKAVLKPMVKSRSGSIVNITSVIGLTGNAGQSNYAASKAGLIGFTKSIAQEVASRNIRLNCVAPGFIETEMTDVLSDKQKEEIFSKIPMNKMGSVKDIAESVSFLLGDQSSYITGQTLSVNGGLFMA